MSISNFAEAAILDALFNNVSLTVVNTYVKLHIGDPGETGTANAAAHTTRIAASWGPASGGTISNDAAVIFTALSAAETISYISIWDNLTAGNFIWSGIMTASKTVAVADTLTFPIASIAITLD